MTPGQAAYEAYFMERDGDPGGWTDLRAEQHAAWEAAGVAAVATSAPEGGES